MDLLQEIKQRAGALRAREAERGIEAVIRHIEAAERYLLRGRREHDDGVFNDVVYRANQAFEGSLKEAFSLFTQRNANKKTPAEIEKHLLDNQILAPRVVELLTNYRQRWRNPSTHDHTLFFGEQEALLAIVSVSAFVRILIDQMIETATARVERDELQKRRQDVLETLGKYQELSFPDQIAAVLRFFAADAAGEDLRSWSAPEFVGHIVAYLESADPDIQVLREPILSEGEVVRPDLLVSKGDQKVIVEIQRMAEWSPPYASGRKSQLLTFLNEGGVDHAILFSAPEVPGDPMRIERVPLVDGDREMDLQLIVPTLP